MADNIPAWAGDSGKVDGPEELTLYRVENEDMVDLGEHAPEQAKKLAIALSQENPGIEYIVDSGSRASVYRDGVYRGWIKSNTGREAHAST